jgi:hypothetical protein
MIGPANLHRGHKRVVSCYNIFSPSFARPSATVGETHNFHVRPVQSQIGTYSLHAQLGDKIMTSCRMCGL